MPAPNPLNAAVAAFAAALAGATGIDPITFSSPEGGAWELRRIDIGTTRQTAPAAKAEPERHGDSRPKADRVHRYVGTDDHPK